MVKMTPKIKKLIYESDNIDDIKVGFELLKANGVSRSTFYYHLDRVWAYNWDSDIVQEIGSFTNGLSAFRYKIKWNDTR